MPYTKKVYRKPLVKKYRRKRRTTKAATTNYVRKTVARAVRKNTEIVFAPSDLSGSLSSSPSANALCYTKTGGMIGIERTAKSLYANLTFTNTSTTAEAFCRVMIISCNSITSDIDFDNQLYQTSGGYRDIATALTTQQLMYNPIMTKEFKVHYSKVIRLGAANNTVLNHIRNVKIFKKHNRKMKYITGPGADVEWLHQNSLWLVMVGDSTVNYTGFARFYYTDA